VIFKSTTGGFVLHVEYQRDGESIMRFLIIAAVLASALPLVPAFAQTAPRPAPPKISETQDAGKKAEYLESRPYKPCPSSVVFPNGQHACIGLPAYMDSPGELRQPADPLNNQ
jgi:hypothetical protein